MKSLIESNPTKLDLAWNLVISRFSIFKTTAIGCIILISNMNWCYFSAFEPILSNFYDVYILVIVNYDHYNWYRYESNIIIIIKLQSIILALMYEIGTMALLMYYCFLTRLTIAKEIIFWYDNDN